MYRGFQLVGIDFDNYKGSESRCPDLRVCVEWREVIRSNKCKVGEAINGCFLEDGSIDGSKMQENWFPQIEADIFISHSHGDKKLAQELSKWLYVTFGLKAFIDSDVWGYAPDLEEKLLSIYRRYSDQEDYDDLKNFVSAHVHMMLSVALNQMIDNAECLFFLNTPSSISIDAPIEGTTPSPWIYLEIANSGLIRTKTPARFMPQATFTEQRRTNFRLPSTSIPIRHKVSRGHLVELNPDTLQRWKSECRKYPQSDSKKALDVLYRLVIIGDE